MFCRLDLFKKSPIKIILTYENILLIVCKWESLMKLRILDKSNESIISIARGSEPTVRCNPGLCQNVEEILCLKKMF